MKVTRTSPFSGKPHTMDIPNLTPELLYRIEHRNQERQMIQQFASVLTADEREFLMTGITTDEWDKYIPSDE